MQFVLSGTVCISLMTIQALLAADGAANGNRAAKLAVACVQTADELADQFKGVGPILVRSPFVIAGDLSEAELEKWHRQTIGPAARAMARSYFKTAPHEPITVLLFEDDKSYRRFAKQLFGDVDVSVYGYYKPHLRTLVMNIGTGGGTLVHELTHALMDFDFPDVPDWFNEGLASLHEQCRFRPDESGIEGLVNWRLKALQQALADGKLRSLHSLIHDNDFRGDRMSLNYAQARYFCLYLQEQDKLQDFYRAFRNSRANDPLGEQAVLQQFPHRTWAQLDADYRKFVANLRS